MNIRDKLKSKLEKLDISSLSDEQVDAMNKLLDKRTSKNKTDNSLSESEEKYRNIFENIQAIYSETSIDGTILEMSPSIELYTKYKREELIGTNVLDLYFNKEDRKKSIKKIQKEGELRDHPIEIKDKDGAKLHWSSIAKIVKNKNGVPEKFISAFVDITKLHKTIDALTLNEEKYRNIFENIQTIYYEATIDGTILEISPSVEYYTKYKREELIGKNAYDLYLNIEDKGKSLQQMSNEGYIRDFYIVLKDKDGGKIHCSLNAKLIKDKNGVPVKYIGAIIDLTKLNKTIEALTLSEEKYRNIFENIQAVYYEAAIGGTILEISPSVEYFTNYKREDLIGKDVFESYFRREDREKLIQQISKNGTLRDYNVELKDKDGSPLYCSVNAKLIKNKDGVPEKIVGAIIDITQLQKTLNALNASKERFSDIYNNATDIIWTSDLDGNFISMNPAGEKIFGLKFEEEVNPCIKKYLTPESYKIALDNIRSKITKEKTSTTYEVEAIGKGGRKIILEISSFLKYKNNRPIEIFGIARDITERKKAESELSKTREKYIELFESTNDIVYTMDFNGNFTSVNPMAEKLLGYKFEEITEMNMTSYISPETAKVAFDNISKKLRGEAANTLYEVDFVNKDGSYTTLEINSMISYRDGKPYEIFGIARNITERRKAEKELNKTREKYLELSETTNDLVYTVNLEQKFSSMHPKCEKIIGYTAEEIIGMKVNDLITPESVQASDENLKKKLKGDAANTIYEVDFIKKNGSIISLEVNSMFRYKDGKPYEILGVARNITEKKKANEALKKSEDKYKTIFENAPIGIMTADISGNIIEINTMLLQMLGSQSLEATKAINVLNFQPLVDSGFVEAFKKCLQNGISIVTESTYNSKWGKTFDARIYTKPLKDQNKTVTGFQVIVEDISEEKLAETQLKTALTEKEALLRELHHRVKNNMQIIISLINMQMVESCDEVMKNQLRDIQQRVWTMAIIHENLYVSENLSKINFGNYLNKLANNIASSYSSNNNVDLKINVTEVFLDLDTAIPCGLIVNELLTNSFKHAFPESLKGKNNEVFIELTTKGNKFLLTIGDNGIGIKEPDKNTERNTLGLELVEILVNQLKGNIKLFVKKGTRYEIELENK